jgi:hypothetical protein
MSNLKERLAQLGSAAAVATALITQPLLAQTSELLMPVVQAALASVATRADRKDKVPGQLILQSSGRSSVEFTGHRSHSSHRSHHTRHTVRITLARHRARRTIRLVLRTRLLRHERSQRLRRRGSPARHRRLLGRDCWMQHQKKRAYSLRSVPCCSTI